VYKKFNLNTKMNSSLRKQKQYFRTTRSP